MGYLGLCFIKFLTLVRSYETLPTQNSNHCTCDSTRKIPDFFCVAWKVQLIGIPTVLKNVDIDKKCMEFLEEMFENTDRMGASGNEQWRLDVGYHQGGWNLEIDAPKLWDDKK